MSDERQRWLTSRRVGPKHTLCHGEAIAEDDEKGFGGVWTRERLLAMDRRFSEALARELRPKRIAK